MFLCFALVCSATIYLCLSFFFFFPFINTSETFGNEHKIILIIILSYYFICLFENIANRWLSHKITFKTHESSKY